MCSYISGSIRRYSTAGILSNSHSISCDEADNLETIDCGVASLGLSDDIQPVRTSNNSQSYGGRSVQSCNERLWSCIIGFIRWSVFKCFVFLATPTHLFGMVDDPQWSTANSRQRAYQMVIYNALRIPSDSHSSVWHGRWSGTGECQNGVQLLCFSQIAVVRFSCQYLRGSKTQRDPDPKPQSPACMNSTANALGNADKGPNWKANLLRKYVHASKAGSIDDNATELTLPGFSLLVPSGIPTFLPEIFLVNLTSNACAWSNSHSSRWRSGRSWMDGTGQRATPGVETIYKMQDTLPTYGVFPSAWVVQLWQPLRVPCNFHPPIRWTS